MQTCPINLPKNQTITNYQHCNHNSPKDPMISPLNSNYSSTSSNNLTSAFLCTNAWMKNWNAKNKSSKWSKRRKRSKKECATKLWGYSKKRISSKWRKKRMLCLKTSLVLKALRWSMKDKSNCFRKDSVKEKSRKMKEKVTSVLSLQRLSEKSNKPKVSHLSTWTNLETPYSKQILSKRTILMNWNLKVQQSLSRIDWLSMALRLNKSNKSARN